MFESIKNFFARLEGLLGEKAKQVEATVESQYDRTKMELETKLKAVAAARKAADDVLDEAKPRTKPPEEE